MPNYQGLFYRLLDDANSSFTKMATIIQNNDTEKQIIQQENQRITAEMAETDKALLKSVKKITTLEAQLARSSVPSTSAGPSTSSGSTFSSLGINTGFQNMEIELSDDSSLSSSVIAAKKNTATKRKYQKAEVYICPTNDKSDNKQKEPVVSIFIYICVCMCECLYVCVYVFMCVWDLLTNCV